MSLVARKQPLKRLMLSSAICTLTALSACQSVENTTGFANIKQDRESNVTEVAKIRTTLAGQYIKNNQLDAAMRQLQQALQADTQYAPAYDMMGVLLQQEGSSNNLQKADGYFKKAIALDADFMQAHNNYGVYLSQVGRYDEAAEQFVIASTALGYRGRISALENLGRTYLQLGKPQQAKSVFIKVLDNNPNSAVAHIELVDLLLAEQTTGSKQYAQNLFNELMIRLGYPSVDDLPKRMATQYQQLQN